MLPTILWNKKSWASGHWYFFLSPPPRLFSNLRTPCTFVQFSVILFVPEEYIEILGLVFLMTSSHYPSSYRCRGTCVEEWLSKLDWFMNRCPHTSQVNLQKEFSPTYYKTTVIGRYPSAYICSRIQNRNGGPVTGSKLYFLRFINLNFKIFLSLIAYKPYGS